MTKQQPAETSTPPPAPPSKDEPLSDQQLEQVSGAGDGRRVIDCEGYTAMTSAVLSPTSTKKP